VNRQGLDGRGLISGRIVCVCVFLMTWQLLMMTSDGRVTKYPWSVWKYYARICPHDRRKIS